jgi:capsular polysaccharide biosynthesis protein
MAQERLGNEYINKFFLPLLLAPPTWQNELLVRLSSQKYLHPTSKPYQPFQVFRVNKLLLPVLSHRAIALEWLRRYLALSFKKTDPLDLFTAQNSIIMVTRYDARRRRIANISEIENFILSLGGKLLDPSTLSIAEKLLAFRDCRFCIAESSGCMNYALFAPRYSHLIALTDPTALEQKEFVPGGWDYATGYAHNASFVVGEDPAPLLGSPLGSATYSLSIIQKLLAARTP